tara:strand:+ start:1610 stop:2056 length:447 start_codon:yes stop_codon:yes gene_type:complete
MSYESHIDVINRAIYYIEREPIDLEWSPEAKMFTLCALRSILRVNNKNHVERTCAGRTIRDNWIFSEFGYVGYQKLNTKKLAIRQVFIREIEPRHRDTIFGLLDLVLTELDKDATVRDFHPELNDSVLLNKLDTINAIKDALDPVLEV